MTAVDIAWLNKDGTGGFLGADGRAVKVSGAVPGDRLTLDATGSGIGALITPSPRRQSPPCPDVERCGGCDLSHLDVTGRHDALAAVVARALSWEGPVPVLPSPRPTGHRARISLAVEAHPSGSKVGYRARRSHDLVEVADCGVARPEVQRAHHALVAWAAAHPNPGVDRVELRSDGDRVVINVRAEGRLNKDQRLALAELGDVAVDGRRLSGDPVLELQGLDVRLRASPSSFYQVNLEANLLLAAYVRQQVLEASPERVLDLYAGNGNLTLPLAAAGLPIAAVEREGQATSDLKHMATEQGLHGIELLTMPAERFEPSRSPFDVVVLNPPRAGAGSVLGRVLRNRPRRVVYVACDIGSAARDISRQAKGYTLTAVQAVDLFPDTSHIESVLTLDRS